MRVVTFTALGKTPVSDQSPVPTLKSSRLSVASPVRTGFCPAFQLNTKATGLLMPRRLSWPSARYRPLPRAVNLTAV